MSELITKEYVRETQFFQMPKGFFNNPKYMPMRCESKLAYMLMLDLLPLSIENNWVNKNGEVFVKLSRDKLMTLLNIKGSQKAAQVMKELVSYGLIINKKVGLNKCNEIYLYHLEGASPKESPPTNRGSGPDQQEQKPVSPSTQSLAADMEEVQYILANQIYLDDLKQQFDPGLVEEIGNSICEMFLNTTTPIGKQDKPMVIMQDVIRKLKFYHIEHVINQYKEVSAQVEIFNPKRYLQTMIYNSIYETDTKVFSHIWRNFGYC